ncbi:Putative alkylhydroperoxidase AhpD [Mycobacteroides abscessus]|nr:Putative alkylhydroperoxidase AhpD [Mycobacteroides abscessus]
MSIENLKEALPEYAKDLKLNLGTVARGTVLSQSQLWGTLVATAAATRNEQVFKEIREEAAGILTPEALDAALGAASIMAIPMSSTAGADSSTAPMTTCGRDCG